MDFADRHHDVIVLGAGVAGLAAAARIARARRRVLVLEARDRIGGRVFAHHDASAGVPLELGGEFLDRTANPAWDLAMREGLAGVDVPDEHWYVERGHIARAADFWPPVQRALAAARHGPDRAFAAFLRQHFPGPRHARLRARATAYVEGFHAADAARASTHELADVEQAVGFGGPEQIVLTRGASALVAALERDLVRHGGHVRLASPAERVHWRRGHVVVDVAAAAGPLRVQARALVVTLPLPLLAAPRAPGGVHFAPALIGKQRAAARLAMGTACKLLLVFDGRPWERAARRDGSRRVPWTQAKFVHVPDADVPTWWTALPVRAPVLTAWAAGPAARRLVALGERDRLRRVLTALAHTTGRDVDALQRRLRSIHWHDWQRDPFARGAYSYVAVGGQGARAQLAAPLRDTLFFAGEATAGDDAATIHGAFASGERAARELLAHPTRSA